ncbi:MAG: hypothetical protein ACO3X1_13495, partial [Burkholderiaceae bacterium]
MIDEQGTLSKAKATQALVCGLPDDWHLHLRDGDALKSVVLATALQFGRAIVMPNLKPPVTNVRQALAYRQRILDALKLVIDETVQHIQRYKTSEALATIRMQHFFNRPDASADWMLEQLQQAAHFEPLMTLYLTDQTAPSDIDEAVDSGFVR